MVLLTGATLLALVNAQPLNRAKRVSDQRLAELETLIALAKMKGKLVTVPVGFGLIDPAKLGRRRRSIDVDDELMEQLARDLGLETMDKFPLSEEDYQDDDEYDDKKRTRDSSSLQRLHPLSINRRL